LEGISWKYGRREGKLEGINGLIWGGGAARGSCCSVQRTNEKWKILVSKND
jgi:hypothetical protein